MRILTPIASILLTFALAAPLAAQETENVAEEGVIVVLGEGLEDTPSVVAYSSSEIERETIISAPSGRIEDVLSNVAGFQQFRRSDSRSSNPSAQGVTLRALGGNATSRALALLDGVPIADPFFGYVPLSSIANGSEASHPARRPPVSLRMSPMMRGHCGSSDTSICSLPMRCMRLLPVQVGPAGAIVRSVAACDRLGPGRALVP